jgi:hypothetical protein
MAYAVAGPGDRKSRPASVSVARLSLFLLTALVVVYAAFMVVGFVTLRRATLDNRGDVAPAWLSTLGTVLPVGLVAGSVLIAVCFSILGVFVGRGSNPARIVSCALAVFVALCCGCNALGSALQSVAVVGSAQTTDHGDWRAQINAGTPVWVTAPTAILGVLIVIALVVVIILLLLPPSNAYFRRDQNVPVDPSSPKPVGQEPGAPG